MANKRCKASNQSGATSNCEPKTYTTIPRTWPQWPSDSHAQNSTGSVNTNVNGQNNHASPQHNNNLPTPMERWLAESQQASPFNTVSSVGTPSRGQGSAVQGGERMERGNGGNGGSAEGNWSMERNEQSERWA